METFSDLVAAIKNIFPIKAASLGVWAQGDFGVGAQAGFGLAMDIASFGTSASVYGFARFVEGQDAGIEVGVVVGFWVEKTEGILGTYVGAEVDIFDIVGAEALAFTGNDDKGDFLPDDGVNLQYAKVLFLLVFMSELMMVPRAKKLNFCPTIYRIIPRISPAMTTAI